MQYGQYSEYIPGDIVREWRRTGGLRVTSAMPKVRLEKHTQHTETLPIEEMPTMCLYTTGVPTAADLDQLIEQAPNLQSRKIEAVRPAMPTDEHDRPYLAIINPYEDTVDLAESLILKYRELRGEYPTEIILSSLRYLTRHDDHFIIGNKRIPYIHDIHVEVLFDVIVRGGNWMS